MAPILLPMHGPRGKRFADPRVAGNNGSEWLAGFNRTAWLKSFGMSAKAMQALIETTLLRFHYSQRLADGFKNTKMKRKRFDPRGLYARGLLSVYCSLQFCVFAELSFEGYTAFVKKLMETTLMSTTMLSQPPCVVPSWKPNASHA